MTDGKPRILIVRFSAIGDVVRVIPALHTLRDVFPDARIDWAVERKSRDILKGHPQLDEVLVFNRPDGRRAGLKAFLSFVHRIRANRYDVVLDFHGVLKSGLLCGFSGAGKRFGFARPRGRELSWLFVNNRVKLPDEILNRVEENLLLVEGYAIGRRNVEMHVEVPEGVQDEVDGFFSGAFEGAKLVVAMHAAVDRPEKQWPLRYYAQLADYLLADGRFEVMLTWGSGQLPVAQRVQELSRRTPYIAPETPTLKHLAWLLQRSHLYVGGDTGPMHLAAAMDTPVVAIFGGTDPRRHAPYLRHHEAVHPGGQFNARGRMPPGTAVDLLASISPERVYDTCTRLIANTRASGTQAGAARQGS